MRALTDPIPLIPLPTGRFGLRRKTPKRKGGSKPPFPKRAELRRRRRRERQARRATYRARRR